MSAFSRKSTTEKPILDALDVKDLKHENPILLELEHALTKLALSKLTNLQKTILLKLYYDGNGEHTFSSLVRRLSAELDVPESTLKWSLRVLRDLGLIESGSMKVRGIPVSLTYAGLTVAKNIAEGMDHGGLDNTLALLRRRDNS